ncbi:MAG: sulfatase-like hydrolase/transferase, partial [Segetibacter sp.]
KKPFFLYYSLTIPHEPLVPTDKFLGKSGINRVADLILQMDATVGTVLDALKRLKLDQNTIVILTSDNGHGPGTGVPALIKANHNPSRPFRGYKGSLLEGGHRIPFIVRWPSKVKENTVNNNIISLNSLMATCAELLNIKLPSNAGEDSWSILPLLLNKSNLARNPHTLVHAGVNGFAVREGSWKLIEAKEVSGERQKTHPEASSGLYN